MKKKSNHSSNYDDEPVQYCSHCYSLRIHYEPAIDSDCCMDCGCSDMSESSIEDWERLYENRYGHKYVSKQINPKKTYIFNLPLNKLKTLVYNHPRLSDIATHFYPQFPGGLSKIDTTLLLFDKLIKDCKLDDLKLLLVEWKHKK